MKSFLTLTSVIAILGAKASLAAQSPGPVAESARPSPCVELSTQSIALPNVRVISAVADSANGDLSAACVVTGAANERIGVDGKHYALGFELRLPDKWNGRFLHQVNGGNDGEIVPAIGNPKEMNAVGGVSALARGFAVLSSDEGHSGSDPANAALGLGAGAAFGLDPQARRDYGYWGDETLGPIAIAIIAKYYGAPPARSYMMGCSNGGRHAMVAASRMGDAYDGFVAGDPGYDLPRAAIQHAWDVQNFLTIDPDIKKAFSEKDMALIAGKVLEACDRLDGAVDGMVDDIKACQRAFHLSDLQCGGDKTDACLTSTQISALTRDFAGPTNSNGEQLYADWPFDGGLGGRNWRFWKIFSGVPPWNGNPLIATMGAASLAGIFSTPPVPTRGDPDSLVAFLQHFDFDRDASKIYARGHFAGGDGTSTSPSLPGISWRRRTPTIPGSPRYAPPVTR